MWLFLCFVTIIKTVFNDRLTEKMASYAGEEEYQLATPRSSDWLSYVYKDNVSNSTEDET